MFAEGPPKEIVEHISFDPLTGAFTRNVCGVELRADAVGVKGYRSVVFKRRRYLAHRLAWFFIYGLWPTSEIDHKNRDKADNRIDNLRLATRSQNMANRKTTRNGLKGVTLHKSGRYQAQIRLNGKSMYLGLFGSEQEAHLVYSETAVRLKGEFARAS